MGLADETQRYQQEPNKQALADAGSPAPTGTPESVLETPIASEITPSQGAGEVSDSTAQNVSDTSPAPTEPSVQPEQTYEIAGEKFTSIDEAMEFAREAARERAMLEARQQGYQDAIQTIPQQGQPAAAAPSKEEEEAEYWQDPVGWQKRQLEKQQEQIQHLILQQQQVQKNWDDFYTKHPDLKRSDKFVKYVLQDPDYAYINQMSKDKGFNELARVVREHVRTEAENAKPQQVLQNKPVVDSPVPGGAPVQKTQESSPEPLDFMSQIAKTQKKGR